MKNKLDAIQRIEKIARVLFRDMEPVFIRADNERVTVRVKMPTAGGGHVERDLCYTHGDILMYLLQERKEKAVVVLAESYDDN